jgi:uncharacterized protein (UPF0548 family)
VCSVSSERAKLRGSGFWRPPARLRPPAPILLTLADGPLGNTPPPGFAHDVSRSNLGHEPQTFEAARDAFLRWQQFALGWVQVLNPGAEIAPGQLVGIEVHTAFLWSVIFNRIVETVDSPSRFGFMYATTALHVEQGQERFVVEFDPSGQCPT